MNTAVVGLGSNIDPEENIEKALQLLRGRLNILKESSFVRNPACGNTKQPEFINGAILVKTDLERPEFKALLKTVEVEMGRTKAMTGQAPRTLDLDIHVWNHEVVDPYFFEWLFIRRFVLELIPDLPYDLQKVRT